MTRVQVLAITVCTVINMVDGFDILASAFTAFAIGREWTLHATDFGVLFSSGLAGMTVGALLLSPLADFWGRRKTVLLCITITSGGMLLSALAPTFWSLVAARAATGIGVGAMMATINTIVAEYSNDRRRDLAVCVQAAGFPLGGAVGGLGVYFASDVSWRWVYAAGGTFSALLIVAVVTWLPESLDFLLARRPRHALKRVNELLGWLALPPMDRLPVAPVGILKLVAVERWSGIGLNGVLICASFFLSMFSFYFLTNWMPKLLSDYGFSARVGVSGSVFLSLGGVIGDLAFAALTLRWAAHRLGPAFMIGCFLAVVLFTILPLQLGSLIPISFVIGILLFGSIASLYAIVPQLYPAAVRTSGTGLALGMGRIGATAGPYVGGLLIAASWNRTAYILMMSVPLVACAAMIRSVSRHLIRAAPRPKARFLGQTGMSN